MLFAERERERERERMNEGAANDAQHISLAELNAVVKGVSTEQLQWQRKRVAPVHTIKHRVNVVTSGSDIQLNDALWASLLGAHHADWKSKNTHQGNKRDADKGERLDTLKSLVSEYDLTISVTLVIL